MSRLRRFQFLPLLFVTVFTTASAQAAGSPPACASTAHRTARIVNGVDCPAPASPVAYVRSRYEPNAIVGLCSGVLVGRRSVVTAAHCFDVFSGRRPKYTTVSLGGKLYRVRKVSFPGNLRVSRLVYPDGTSQNNVFNYDVAVLDLARAVPLSPVRVLRGYKVKAGDIGSILGYGFDENGNSETLKAGATELLGENSKFVFADYREQQLGDTCSRDSGGPLLVEGAVIALTSNGTGSGCGGPEISSYSRLDSAHVRTFLKRTVPDIRFQEYAVPGGGGF